MYMITFHLIDPAKNNGTKTLFFFFIKALRALIIPGSWQVITAFIILWAKYYPFQSGLKIAGLNGWFSRFFVQATFSDKFVGPLNKFFFENSSRACWMLLESTFLNGIQKSTFSALMSAAYQLHLLRARESYSLPFFSKNVAVGKRIYWIKTRVRFIPAEMFYVFCF